MSLWHIAWKYLWNRWFTTTLTILSVALAVGLISAILTIRNETKKRFEEEQLAYDIVVGGPGSPLQLVLNAVYYLDSPGYPISYENYLRLKEEDDVTYAFPIALGDTYKGFRIVGTTVEIFEYPWTSDVTGEQRYPYQIDDGRFFDKPMEAVLGYRVSRELGLTVGATFIGLHGTMDLGSLAEFDHADKLYTVVGVLKPSGTSNDRAIFVDLQSVWDLHAEHDEEEAEGEHVEEGDRKVSAVLIDLESSAYRFQFMQTVYDNYPATPAMPIVEITNLYNEILQPVVVIMIAVGYVVVVISALSIMIGLYLSIIQRKRDLAIMRALGASAYEIFGAVMIEALLVTVIGVACGWALGKGVAIGLGVYMSANYGFTIHGAATSMLELKFFAVVTLIGLFAGIVPAWQAYQSDIAEDLQST
ncbi:MAG: ABC transporter permease [Candidatus Hydrogenedentota bacterium]